MSTPKPTILVVPGSFAQASSYTSLIASLRALNYPAVALQLPTTQKRMPLPPASMLDDADVIKRAVETLISQGKEVVVMCHSYGGVPTTQALVGLNVKRLVYLSALVPKLGQSLNVASTGEEKTQMEAVDGYLHIDAVSMAAYTCNDLPWEISYEHTLDFTHHSAVSFSDAVTQVAYAAGDVPVSYLLCEKDMIVAPEKQRAAIKVLEEAGRKVSVMGLEAGHCPMWSMPGRLAEVLVGEVEKGN